MYSRVPKTSKLLVTGAVSGGTV